jgi:hypothetical protein
MRSIFATAAVLAVAGAASAGVGSINVIPTANAASLQSSLVSDGSVNITGFSVSGQSFGNVLSTGLYTLSGGGNAYGLERDGIVISSGNVADYSTGPNTVGNKSFNFRNGSPIPQPLPDSLGVPATAAQEALLDPITGGSFDHYDTTQIDITFTMNAGFNTVGFDVVFGSEEWAEFVGTAFVDGFGLYLNGTNIALTAGLPININHPGMMNLPETELDGVLIGPGGPVLRFQQPAQAGVNTLTIILADTSDGILDTTAYISGFGIPAPGSAGLLALAGIAAARRRRA